MINVYKSDCSGFRQDYVASFNSLEEAHRFIDSHPQDFIGTIPVIK